LALTSPRSGGRSVGIVCSRTQATELVILFDTSNMLFKKKGNGIAFSPENILLAEKYFSFLLLDIHSMF
jgi:hypothetical protein